MNFHKIQTFIIVALLIFGSVYAFSVYKHVSLTELFLPNLRILKIGDTPHRVDIANTEEERQKGLSGRKELGDAEGMLFVFPKSDYHAIWMKDMNFPIDLIWIGEDLKVISVQANVDPNTYPRSFRPERPARYLLEAKTTFIETYSVQPGDVVQLPPRYLDD